MISNSHIFEMNMKIIHKKGKLKIIKKKKWKICNGKCVCLLFLMFAIFHLFRTSFAQFIWGDEKDEVTFLILTFLFFHRFFFRNPPFIACKWLVVGFVQSLCNEKSISLPLDARVYLYAMARLFPSYDKFILWWRESWIFVSLYIVKNS